LLAKNLSAPLGVRLPASSFTTIASKLAPTGGISMAVRLIKPAVFAVLAGFSVLWLSPASLAASFDCDRAKAPDEKTICATRSLNDQDVTMALLYDLNRHFMAMGGRGSLMDDQAVWLKQRHTCGAQVSCLSKAYTERIAMLRSFIDERVMTKGPF